MMRNNIFLAVLCCVMFIPGCGPSFTSALEPGNEVPAGKVLVIGKFAVDPPFESSGKKKKDDAPLDIQIGLTFDLSQTIKEGALYSPDEAISPILYEVFFYPFPPGIRYIRTGQVLKVIGYHSGGPAAGKPLYEVLRAYKNIKLDVPSHAKAVYIGTIIYRHDGNRIVSVAVRDDYSQAMQEMAKMKVPGLKAGDVVKKLATVK